MQTPLCNGHSADLGMVSREDSEQGLGPRGITLPTQEREKLASGMASALVHPSPGSQGGWLGPTAFFCLTYRAKPVADSC